MPIQLRGPSPNGRNAQGWRVLILSGVKRSGSKMSGSGYKSASWCIA